MCTAPTGSTLRCWNAAHERRGMRPHGEEGSSRIAAALLCLALVAAAAPVWAEQSEPPAARGSETIAARGPDAIAARGSVTVAFPPWDDAETLIVGAIGRARSEVLMHAFSFSSRPIARALAAAQRRGVRVRVLADRDQLFSSGGNSRIPELAAAGVSVALEVRYASAHNKVMVIDAAGPEPAVITGSYNWTWSAQNRNAENVLLLRGNPELARRYAANWQRHAAQALPYDSGNR